MGRTAPDRAAVEARLDALVRRHRFTIAVVFPLVGAALLVASAEGIVPPPLRFNPALVVVGAAVMRLPLVAGVLPTVDRRAALAVVALVAYTYAVEFVGVATGWPYGEFRYGVDLGPMVFGAVPLGLPVFFPPLALDAYLLVLAAAPTASRAARVAASVAVLIAIDLVLDPGAVALGFWEYAAPGAYYGVPASNYAGWLASGAVAVAALDWGFDPAAVRARLAECAFALDDVVSFVVLWGGVNAWAGNAVPVAVAAALFAVLVRAGRFDVAAWRRPAA